MELDHVELDELRIRPSGNRPTDDLPNKTAPDTVPNLPLFQRITVACLLVNFRNLYFRSVPCQICHAYAFIFIPCTLIPRQASFVWIVLFRRRYNRTGDVPNYHERNKLKLCIHSLCLCLCNCCRSLIYLFIQKYRINKRIKMHQTNIQYRYFN